MPSFNEMSSNIKSKDQEYELQWMKASELEQEGIVFCIDAIRKSTKEDMYGKTYWYIRCITEEIDAETTRICFKLPRSEARDNFMSSLAKELQGLKDLGSDDCLIHGCFVTKFESKVPGYKPSFGLAGYSTAELKRQGCPCKFFENEDFDGLGDLEDHPF
jgi:hypothetical protein